MVMNYDAYLEIDQVKSIPILDSRVFPGEYIRNGVMMKKFLRKKPQTDSLAKEETLINMNGDLSLPALFSKADTSDITRW